MALNRIALMVLNIIIFRNFFLLLFLLWTNTFWLTVASLLLVKKKIDTKILF